MPKLKKLSGRLNPVYLFIFFIATLPGCMWMANGIVPERSQQHIDVLPDPAQPQPQPQPQPQEQDQGQAQGESQPDAPWPLGQSAQRLPLNSSPTGFVNYLLFLPASYYEDKVKAWPFIIFLHGSGERGDDVNVLRKLGLPYIVDQKKDFPFVVVSPQCPAGEYWSPAVIKQLRDYMLESVRVDRHNLYLTGLSMGGVGTWSTAIAYPKAFAAIAPISGGGDTRSVCRIKHLPVWAFHGAKDDVVPPAQTISMVNGLKKCGGDVKLTLYPDLGHDAWTRTYESPELYLWFMEHSRQDITD